MSDSNTLFDSDEALEDLEFAAYLRAKEIYLQLLGTETGIREVLKDRATGSQFLFELAQDLEMYERIHTPKGIVRLRDKAAFFRVDKEVGDE